MTSKHIVIIGGGITGLSAAWEIQNHPQIQARYSLLEADSRWGGKVVTAAVPGPQGGQFIIDGGAESIVTRKPEAWDLAHELDLSERIQDPGSETTDMFVLNGGEPVSIPLTPGAFIRSKLLSTRGKLRLMAEPFIPARRDSEDETLAEFASRRLGTEAMEKFIGPVLAGIYNTDPHQQSIMTTSPIMREMEAEYGGLFKAVIGRMRAAKTNSGTGPKRPRFITFQGGSAEIVDALAAKLGGDLRLNATVTRVEKAGAGYRVHLASGESLLADALVLATPANIAADLLQPLAPDAAAQLGEIRHSSIGTISLFYKADDLQLDYKINGLMIPRRENRKIDAVTFPTNKMPNRAPDGFSVVRVFFGAGAPDLVILDDAALTEMVLGELRALLGIQAMPVDSVAFRWPESFPQADVGHLERVAEIESQLPESIYVTGSSYRGIGVPDCVRQGRETARQALENLVSVAA
jgi:oxygen-dependent protoporphyrinogen oxidase